MPDQLLGSAVPDAADRAANLVIFGSCVTRDALEFADPQRLRLGEYYARSSFASSFGSAPVEDRFSGRITSSFQRRQVQRDFRKSFGHVVVSQDFDLLLVDFIDERFPIFQLDDGRLVTVSVELGRTDFPGPLRGRLVKPCTDEHFELWQSGWCAFIDLLRRCGRLDRLRINRVQWSRATERGADFGPASPDAAIEQANRYLFRLYERAVADVPASHVYSYAPELFVGSDSHRWGKAPFHYVGAFYHATLVQIGADISRAGPPCRAAMTTPAAEMHTR